MVAGVFGPMAGYQGNGCTMKEAVIVRVVGQIGMTQEVVKTVIAVDINDAMEEVEACIAKEASSKNRWYVINKAEVIGPCLVTNQVLSKETTGSKT